MADVITPIAFDLPPDPQNVQSPTALDPTTPVPFDYGVQITPMDVPPERDVVLERSKKWNFGLGVNSPGVQHLFNQISTGNESREEDLQRTNEAFRNTHQQKEILKNYITGQEGEFNKADIFLIQNMHKAEIKVPSEDFFAAKYANQVVNTTFEGFKAGAKLTEPDYRTMDFAEKAIYLKQGTQRLAENLKAKYDAGGFAGKIIPNLERFVPLLYDARMRSEFWALTGNDLMEQYQSYFLKDDPVESMAAIKKQANLMFEKNPEAAIQFLHGFAAFSSSDAITHNMWSIIDFGVAGSLTFDASRRLLSMGRATVKAVGNRTADPIAILEASGDTKAAGRAVAVKLLNEQVELATGSAVQDTTKVVNSLDYLTDKTLTLQSGVKALESPAHSSRELGRRLAEMIEGGKERLLAQLTGGPIRVQRLEAESEAMKAAEAEASAVFNKKYPTLTDRILDVRTSNLDEAITANQFRIFGIGQRQIPGGHQLEVVTAADVAQKPGMQTKDILLQASNYNSMGPIKNLSLADRATQINKELKQGIEEANYKTNLRVRMVELEKEMRDWVRAHKRGETKPSDLGRMDELKREAEALREEATASLRPKNFDVVGLAGTETAPQPRFFKASNDNFTTVLGTGDLTPYVTKESAHKAAMTELKLGPGFRIAERDGGYVIEIPQAIDETALAVRNQLAIDTKNQAPPGWIRFMTNLLPVSKNSKLNKDLMESANIAGYGLKDQQAFIKTFLDPVSDLLKSTSSKEWNDFKTFLDRQRHYSKDGEFGRFSRNFGEMESDWFTEFGKLPTPKEQAAYWSYVQLSDVDWTLRNLAVYRDKTRQGREMFGFRVTGAYDWTNNVEGKLVHDLPRNPEVPYSYAAWDPDPKKIKIFASDRAYRDFDKIHARTRDSIAQGDFKVVQLSEYGEDQLRKTLGVSLPKGRINYVVTADIRSSPLEFQQIPYRPGGHRIYDYGYYARQPIVDVTGDVNKTTWYRGDLNHMAFDTKADALDYTKRFNTARDLYAKAIARDIGPVDLAATKAYVEKNLPYSMDRFLGFFRGEEGLKASTPLHVTPAGVNVDKYVKLEDAYKSINPGHRYVRTSESPHNLNNGQVNLAYSQERGDVINAIENVGSKTQPQYNMVPAKFLDPMVAAHRAASTIANSRILDDLKIKAAERFIAEFSDGLAPSLTQLRANPLQALIDAPIKAAAHPADRLAIYDARRATLELLGMRTQVQKGIDMVQQHIYEDIIGPKVGGWAYEHTPQWLWSTIKDPTRALRTVAFELKQGLGNIAALTNQAQILTSISAIETTAASPLRVVRAGIAGQYMSMLRFWENDEKMIAHFAKNQSKMGMTEEQFRESYAALKETAFHKVGRETADWNMWLSEPLVDTKFGQVLDYGKGPFRRGEELGRYTGWNAAYLRWREANPTALFDSAAKAEVLARADFLNLNMSGVSNSMLQKGIPGVVTQFFTAHLRQMEQVVGGKLSPSEVARLMTVNSIMYGTPVGIAGPLIGGLWPVRQQVLQDAKMTSHPTDDSVADDLVVNGFMSSVLEQATGMKYDVGGLGLGGVSFFKDLIEGQKSTWDILTGVSGRSMKGVVEAAYPFHNYIMSMGQRPLKRADFTDLLENVSTMTQIEKAWYGISVGKYFGRNEQRLDNITGTQAIISALTGLQPQSMADMSAALTAGKNIDAFQTKVEKRYALYMRRGFEALSNGDQDGGHDWFDRANREFVLGNFKEIKRTQMLARALQDNQALVDRVERGFAEKLNTPEGMEAYQRYLKKRGM